MTWNVQCLRCRRGNFVIAYLATIIIIVSRFKTGKGKAIHSDRHVTYILNSF